MTSFFCSRWRIEGIAAVRRTFAASDACRRDGVRPALRSGAILRRPRYSAASFGNGGCSLGLRRRWRLDQAALRRHVGASFFGRSSPVGRCGVAAMARPHCRPRPDRQGAPLKTTSISFFHAVHVELLTQSLATSYFDIFLLVISHI